MAYKLRVRDTIDNLELFVDFLKFLEDEHYLVINSISSRTLAKKFNCSLGLIAKVKKGGV